MDPIVLHIIMSFDGGVIVDPPKSRGLGRMSKMVCMPPGPLQVVMPEPKPMQVVMSALAGISLPMQQVITAAVAMVALIKFMVVEKLVLRRENALGQITWSFRLLSKIL